LQQGRSQEGLGIPPQKIGTQREDDSKVLPTWLYPGLQSILFH
jgi:hypothetical protein